MPAARSPTPKVMREDIFDVALDRRRRINRDVRKVKNARPAAKGAC